MWTIKKKPNLIAMPWAPHEQQKEFMAHWYF